MNVLVIENNGGLVPLWCASRAPVNISERNETVRFNGKRLAIKRQRIQICFVCFLFIIFCVRCFIVVVAAVCLLLIFNDRSVLSFGIFNENVLTSNDVTTMSQCAS